jgi:HK97 family phage major capsid protein
MKEVIEKLDAIEATQVAKIDEVKAEVAQTVESAKAEFAEKVAALEAKVSEMGATPVIKTYKTVSQEVNRAVKEQLRDFVKNGSRVEKEVKVFADEGQYDAYMKEASALTGSGAGVGGRTAYDPVFVSLRLMNPMRGVSRSVATEGATYQFRAKTGNAGAMWGYAINNNTSSGANPTTESTNIWQLTLQDLNTQFPIRTAALDDIDGLEGNVVSDMMAEFSQQEGLSMIQNNDQGLTTLPYGGSNGLRGLNQYPGSAVSYNGGYTTTAAYGSSGTGSSSGLHSIATYDQLTTNGDGTTAGQTTNKVTYADVVNFIYALPQQYWTPTAKFIINPVMLSAIRGLTDDQGRPIYVDGLAREDGIVGKLLGFDVVVNNYLDTPTYNNIPDKLNLFPMYFGDFQKGHAIVDRLNMVLRRYDQTLPGFITFYGEKRLCSSVVDPFSIVRYRSTATAGD